MRCSPLAKRQAISALQLVVLLSLLLLAVGLFLPVSALIREEAMRTDSINNLKQLTLSVHAYHDTYRCMPPAVGELNGQNGPAHFHLLPFLDLNPLAAEAKGASWKNNAYGTVVPVFLDPRDTSSPTLMYNNWLATTNYVANWMVFKDGKTTLVQITDGTSNTSMFAQRYQMCNGQPTAWGYPSLHTWAPIYAYYSEDKFQVMPSQETCDPKLPQSLRSTMQLGMCDGSVHSIRASIAATTWYYLTDPNDGNPIALDEF